MTLRESLTYEPVELHFGTSGLRGLVSDMTDLECYLNTVGFIRFLETDAGLKTGGTIYLAGDLRASTPRIMRTVNRAITDLGYITIYCGLVPTPALSLASFTAKAPGIMVTGSHIPADRNGIKFVKPDTEVLKRDEVSINAAVAAVRSELYAYDANEAPFDHNGMLMVLTELPTIDPVAETLYRRRYLNVFHDRPLVGKTIVFYQHSAVGRDLLPAILTELGARVVPTGRSGTFIPLDSENVTPVNEAYFAELARSHPGLFAIISTDGDSDRPFVIDEHGVFHRGDVLGLVVATWLEADSAAYPITTSDAVDTVLDTEPMPYVHTKVGSPYVIEAMQTALAIGSKRPVGWEVNGGFLIGSDLAMNGTTLPALATRDALIAILGALLTAIDNGIAVSEVFARLPPRFTQGELIDGISLEASSAMLTSKADMQVVLSGLTVLSQDALDGVRLTLAHNETIHLRPSGNAPQLRIYTLAASQVRADELAAMVRERIQSRI